MSKLLRVLVAGGMALAGVAGARADDKAADAPTEQAGKGTATDDRQDKPEAKEAKEAKEKKDTTKAEDEKKDSDKKAADSSGGGVKGW